MRNQYGGDCYKCGRWVVPGTGHFEKIKGRAGWRVQHGLFSGHGRITCAMAQQAAREKEKREAATRNNEAAA